MATALTLSATEAVEVRFATDPIRSESMTDSELKLSGGMRRMSIQPSFSREERRKSIVEFLALPAAERRRCSLAGETPPGFVLDRRRSLLTAYGLPSDNCTFYQGYERRNSLSPDMGNPITIVPLEVVLLIFGHMSAAELAKMRLVSQYWKYLAEDDLLWKDLCESDFGPDAEIRDCSTWRDAYVFYHKVVGGETFWSGMSKWVEPSGFDFEQETKVFITFHKHNSTIEGHGITINYALPNDFVISGRRIGLDKFTWEKKFVKHVSKYFGEIDFDKCKLQGTIEYNDGTHQWRGVFSYSMAPAPDKDQPLSPKLIPLAM